MNKAIVLLSGTPSTKSKFIEIAKKSNWIWNIQLQGFLGSRKDEFYWDGETGEYYQSFTHEFFALIYKYFMADDSEVKIAKNKIFNRFLLVVHGVSDSLVSTLEEEYGVFKIHISNRERNDNVELCDVILYEDDDNFEDEVNRVVDVLTKEKEMADGIR